MDDLITYMDYLWLQIDDDVITVGINETGLDELDDAFTVELPEEGAVVVPNEVCGEIVTDQGSINLYAPIDGHIIEINAATKDNPTIITDDNYNDGWLFKIEVDNVEDLRQLEDSFDEDED